MIFKIVIHNLSREQANQIRYGIEEKYKDRYPIEILMEFIGDIPKEEQPRISQTTL